METAHALGYARLIVKKLLRATFGTALVAIGIGACDPQTRRTASLLPPDGSEEIAADETLTDVVRNALADVLRDPDAFSRARRLGTLLPTLGAEQVAAVEQTLEDTTLDMGATELELLLRIWATHQPEDASRWSVEESPPGYRLAAIVSSMTLWATTDPQAAARAALQWTAERPDVGDAVQLGLVRGWFAVDPDAVAQFIRELGIGFPRQRALSIYLRALIQTQGIDAAARWAESVADDDEPYKLAVYRQVAAALPQFDPAAALRWCDIHCESRFGKNLRSILATRWVQRGDGAGALEWLSSAPDNYDNRLAVRTNFALWGTTDREAALDWMAAQTIGEPDPWLRPTFPIYARLLAEDSPADAIEWAERIESDDEREIVLTEVARAWRQVDEAAADAWLLESPLPEEAREKVRVGQGSR